MHDGRRTQRNRFYPEPGWVRPDRGIHPLNLYPSLYQVNTRVLMQELSGVLGRHATLDDVPDEYLDQLSRRNFDWVWFLGVWQTGAAGRKVSRENEEWRREFEQTLPDLTEEDICGSCFAITMYEAHTGFGGNAALDRLRDRVHRRGMKLLLDFVPNHTALDHPWVTEHREFYIHGTEDEPPEGTAELHRHGIRRQAGRAGLRPGSILRRMA